MFQAALLSFSWETISMEGNWRNQEDGEGGNKILAVYEAHYIASS
jgi:hypothetical protein